MLKRVVDALQVIALAAAATTIVLLFAYRPAHQAPKQADATLAVGQRVFTANCAVCHGANGEGLRGPALAKGAVVRAFPRVDDEVALVTNGLDGMPAWGGQLSAAEIDAVVQYTRRGL